MGFRDSIRRSNARATLRSRLHSRILGAREAQLEFEDRAEHTDDPERSGRYHALADRATERYMDLKQRLDDA